MLVVFSEARRSKRRETELWCVEEVLTICQERSPNQLSYGHAVPCSVFFTRPAEGVRAAITNACVQLDCLSLWFPFRFLG